MVHVLAITYVLFVILQAMSVYIFFVVGYAFAFYVCFQRVSVSP